MANTREQPANAVDPVEEREAPGVPECLSWSEQQVADWIEEQGFREYRVIHRPT